MFPSSSVFTFYFSLYQGKKSCHSTNALSYFHCPLPPLILRCRRLLSPGWSFSHVTSKSPYHWPFCFCATFFPLKSFFATCQDFHFKCSVSIYGLKKTCAYKAADGVQATVNHFASIDWEWFKQPGSPQPAEQSLVSTVPIHCLRDECRKWKELLFVLFVPATSWPQCQGLAGSWKWNSLSAVTCTAQTGLSMSTARSHYKLMNYIMSNYLI